MSDDLKVIAENTEAVNRLADEIARQNHLFEIQNDLLGTLLIEADYVTKKKGLNKSTISNNDNLEKFEEIGKRKILISVRSAAAVEARKKTKKGSR